MTRAAPSRAVEVCLACLLVADQDVENLVQPPIRREIDRAVQEGREIRDLRRTQVEARHAAIGPADREKRAKLLPVVVVLYQLRPCEIRPARCATTRRSMTEAALRCQQLLAALDRGRIELRLRWLGLLGVNGGKEGHKGYKGHQGKCPEVHHIQTRLSGRPGTFCLHFFMFTFEILAHTSGPSRAHESTPAVWTQR